MSFKTNICNLLCAKQQGFNVLKEIKDVAYFKAEKIFIDKAIESKECQLKRIKTLPENLRSTFSIEFTSDGKYVATSHSCRMVYVLNAFTLVQKYKIITDRTVWCMSFNPTDNEMLAVGTVKSKVYIYKEGVVFRKYVGLANNDDDNLTPIASIQFHPESLLLLFANRNQIFWYDWENDMILKVISASPDTVVRFVKFIPGTSDKLLTTTTKTMLKERLHETAQAAFDTGNILKLLDIFMIVTNFVIEATEQYKSGNSRGWSYSIGIQYFIRLFFTVIELMENIEITNDCPSHEEGIDLAFTLNCMRQRISVIEMYIVDPYVKSTNERCKHFFTHFKIDPTIAADVLNRVEFIIKCFEYSKVMSLDDLYRDYEKAIWNLANTPRWPKIYYVQCWNVEKEINLKKFYNNLVTISADTSIAVTNDFIVDFNPLLLTIEVISVRKENFGHRTHVLKNFPNFYYFFSVSPSMKYLLIAFKKGLPGYNFETYGIFYELHKCKQILIDSSSYKTVKTNKNWDLNCLEFAPHPTVGLLFGYNGPLLFRLVQ